MSDSARSATTTKLVDGRFKVRFVYADGSVNEAYASTLGQGRGWAYRFTQTGHLPDGVEILPGIRVGRPIPRTPAAAMAFA